MIENTGTQTEDTHPALLTCYMRGWIEPLPHAVPSAQLPADFNLCRVKFEQIEQQYRLTSAGWSALYRTAEIAQTALAISSIVCRCDWAFMTRQMTDHYWQLPAPL